MDITMRRWLGILTGCVAVVALSGCATSGDPSAYERGTHHAQYDRAPTGERYDRFTPDLSWAFGHSSAYYPWWSVDYFYLGFHHYRPSYWWGFRQSSPWYPYHYRPWYPSYAWGWPYRRHDPWYRFGAYDPYWRYRYRGHTYRPPGYHQPDAGHHDAQPVGPRGGQHAGGHRPGIEDGIRDRDRMRRGRGGQSDRGTPPESGSSESRSVMVAPRGEDGRGMVVIGGRDNKVAPNRLEPAGDTRKPVPAGPPIRSQPGPAVSVAPPRNTPPAPSAPSRSVGAPAPRQSAPVTREPRSTVRPNRGPARSRNFGDPENDSGRGAARFRDRD